MIFVSDFESCKSDELLRLALRCRDVDGGKLISRTFFAKTSNRWDQRFCHINREIWRFRFDGVFKRKDYIENSGLSVKRAELYGCFIVRYFSLTFGKFQGFMERVRPKFLLRLWILIFFLLEWNIAALVSKTLSHYPLPKQVLINNGADAKKTPLVLLLLISASASALNQLWESTQMRADDKSLIHNRLFESLAFAITCHHYSKWCRAYNKFWTGASPLSSWLDFIEIRPRFL